MISSILKKIKNHFQANRYRITGAISSVRTRKPLVALTFDDGPHRDFTGALLDVLDRHNAKATFFVPGERIQAHRDVLERMNRSDHCIGIHSWNHSSFPLLTSAERRNQIRACRTALGFLDSGLLRPPFGHLDLFSSIDIYREGYRSIGWSHHAEDWLNHSPDVIFEKLSKRLKPGGIILLHDNLVHFESAACRDRTSTIKAVDKLLSSACQFQFVTVDHLLHSGTPVYRRWRPPTDTAYIEKLLRSPH